MGDNLASITNTIGTTDNTRFAYTYDDAGNRLSRTDIDNIVDQYQNSNNLYKLESVRYHVGQQDERYVQYVYDDYFVYSRRQVIDNGVTKQYLGVYPGDTGYNYLDQYSYVGGVPFIYDNNGNLTDDGVYVYTYDSDNQMIGAALKTGTMTAQYEYDESGLRIHKTVTENQVITVDTRYCYAGGHIIAEYDYNAGAAGYLLSRKYIYGPKTDMPVAMIVVDSVTSGETWYFYQYDGLGSVVSLLDSAGNVVASYDYDVFGQTTITGNSHGNRFMFTGRELDSETGLYYYRARMYCPELGRFMQPDPIGYAGGKNLYAYCGNDPVNWIDPWGLAWYNNWNDFKEGVKNVVNALKEAFKYVAPNPIPGEGLLGTMGIAADEARKRAQENNKNPFFKEQTPYTWDPKNAKPVYVEPKDIDCDGILNWDSNGNFKIDEGDRNICHESK